ncbi:MAG: NifB/NifX family molybdenum-iron cluster-binding protein [Calditrichales bacterium]|nr:NifB/NifX family molybdenum-iron cluster-binding protein [Calditrichales bacterium]
MKKLFAIPTESGKLCAHFGHCEKFAIVETEDQKVVKEEYITPPGHQPGVYPQFLAQQGVSVIISGGMGMKAQQLFAQNNIEVCMGVDAESPKKLVEQYLNDQLKTGQNLCDH